VPRVHAVDRTVHPNVHPNVRADVDAWAVRPHAVAGQRGVAVAGVDGVRIAAATTGDGHRKHARRPDGPHHASSVPQREAIASDRYYRLPKKSYIALMAKQGTP